MTFPHAHDPSLAELKPGQKVPVVVKHQSGTKTTLQVTLATYPGS